MKNNHFNNVTLEVAQYFHSTDFVFRPTDLLFYIDQQYFKAPCLHLLQFTTLILLKKKFFSQKIIEINL